jgi:hypothetical protein
MPEALVPMSGTMSSWATGVRRPRTFKALNFTSSGASGLGLQRGFRDFRL